MKRIDISTKKHPNTFAIVDDVDYRELSKHKWFVRKSGRNFYAYRFATDADSGKVVFVPMHRQILGTASGFETDHINHNGIDNRRCNLRQCNTAQNQHNSVIRSDNTSGYKGVCRTPKSKSWRAQIKLNGSSTHIGSYPKKIDAAKAYDAAARKYFGEYARTNFALQPVT